MKNARLIEKTAVARRLGGTEIIRAHALPERLLISAEIARELGRKKPERSCASKYFRLIKESTLPAALAGIAMRYSLRKELREAIAMHSREDPMLRSKLDSAERLFRLGKKEEARKEVFGAMQSQLADVDPRISRAIYIIYRLKYSEVKPLAKQVFRKKMDAGDFDAAYQVASQWRLWGERKKAAVCCVKKEILAGNFEKARRIAGERGISKKGIRSAAKQVVLGLMEKEEYSAALSTSREFRLRSSTDNAVLAMFVSCMDSNSYLEAAQLAKAYGMKREMGEAAAKLIDSSRDSNLAIALLHAKEFGFEELAKELGRKLIEIQVLFGDYQKAISLADGLGLDTRKLATSWFYNEVKEGKSIKAIGIAIKYGLDKEKKKIGRKMFLKRLRGKDYSGAIKIAETCGLEEEKQIVGELKKFRANASQPR
jgi:hypothetical protein